jgi:hypothetical protein
VVTFLNIVFCFALGLHSFLLELGFRGFLLGTRSICGCGGDRKKLCWPPAVNLFGLLLGFAHLFDGVLLLQFPVGISQFFVLGGSDREMCC